MVAGKLQLGDGRAAQASIILDVARHQLGGIAAQQGPAAGVHMHLFYPYVPRRRGDLRLVWPLRQKGAGDVSDLAPLPLAFLMYEHDDPTRRHSLWEFKPVPQAGAHVLTVHQQSTCNITSLTN